MSLRSVLLSPSDVALVAIVRGIVLGARKIEGEVSFFDHELPILLLCFLSEAISGGKPKRYSNLKSLKYDMVRLADVDTVAVNTDGVFNSLANCSCVEDFMDFAESMKSLFEEESGHSPNNVMAPTKLCSDSSLGILVRTFIVKWNCLSFEQVCCLFESLVRFMNDDDVMSINSRNGSPINNNISSILSNVNNVGSQGDVRGAEDAIHRHYDFDGNDPLTSLQSQSQSKLNAQSQSQTQSPLQALEALKSAVAQEGISSGTRYQQAMLELAAVWCRNGHYELAMSAVEEAMKTAHQRGDHSSVAKALLVLHHVVIGLESGVSHRPRLAAAAAANHAAIIDGKDNSTGSKEIAAEEVLSRCLDRCDTQGMAQLAAQAVLLLARLRSVGPLKWSGPTNNWLCVSDASQDVDDFSTVKGGAGTLKIDENPLKTARSVQTTWMLLLSALIGETKLSSQISKGTGDTLPALAPVAKEAKDLVSEIIPVDSPDFAALTAQTAVVAADFWRRLGVPHMAELECRRALRMLAVRGGRGCLCRHQEELVALCCREAALILELSFAGFFADLETLHINDANAHTNVNAGDTTAAGATSLKNSIDSALNIVRLASGLYEKTTTTIAAVPVSITNMLAQTRLLVAVHGALIGYGKTGSNNITATADFSKAVRLARRLVDATEPTANIYGGLSSSSSSYSSSSSSSDALIATTSQDNARAKLLLARVLVPVDLDESLCVLKGLEVSAARTDLARFCAEAAALQAALSWRRRRRSIRSTSSTSGGGESFSGEVSSADGSSVLLRLHDILSIARRYHFPSVEGDVCRYVANR